MTHGALLAEGKTKQIVAHATNADWAIVVSKDAITAGDGARRHTIPGARQSAAAAGDDERTPEHR